MTRINTITVEQAPISVRSYYQNGYPGDLVASLAQVPELLDVSMPFISMILSPSGLDLRIKEIIVLRSSVLQSCRYCIGTHTVVAHKAGFSLMEVQELRSLESVCSSFSQKEQSLIRYIDQVAGTRKSIEDTLMKELKTLYSDAEVVEITLLIGATMMLNRYCTALEIPLSEATNTNLKELGFDDEH